MGSLTFLSCFWMTVCSTNGFSISNDFKFFQPTSFLQTNTDTSVFPLKANMITDLGLKLAEVLTHTSERKCLKTCQRTKGCLRAVHCKTKPKCEPGTFCLSEETSTCYLAAKTGGRLKPNGTCTISNEVNLQEHGLQTVAGILPVVSPDAQATKTMQSSENELPDSFFQTEPMSQEIQYPPMMEDMMSDFISDILAEGPIQSTNKSNEENLEISVESVELEDDLENKDSETQDELLAQESAKVDRVIGDMHSDKHGEQESPEVSRVLEDRPSKKSGELALRESPKRSGLSGNSHLEKQDQLVGQGSTEVDGVSGNSHLEKKDQLVGQGSTEVDGVTGTSHLEKKDQLVGQGSTEVDGVSVNSHSEKKDQLVGQGSTDVDGVSGNSHSEKKDHRVVQGSPKVDGVSENIPENLGALDNELKAHNSGTFEPSITNDLLALFGENSGTSPKPTQPDNVKTKNTSKSTLRKKETNHPQEPRIPKECMVEPTYVNQGSVKKSTTSRTGYPVVIEYECDNMADEKYKYFSGPREALCDEKGIWTLPAMFCLPTSCYSKVADTSKTETTLYGGDTHQSREGRECQTWSEDEPHSHSVKFKLTGWCYGCGSVEDLGNKCRNMDYEARPWCYTMDPSVRWENCDLQECAQERKCSRPPYIRSAPALRTELIGQKVHVTYRCHADLRYMGGRNVSSCDMETGVWEWPDMLCASEKCFHYDHERKRAMYRGNVSTTKTGKSCQRWDSQWPHKHSITTSFFPGLASLSELGNICRDPDNEGAPWCYTTDPDSRWELCPVPECSLST